MLSQKNLYLLSFAWKTMQRNSGRVVFISCCVSFAAIASIWIFAFLKGFAVEVEKSVVNTNTGHFQLREVHYAQTTDSSFARPFTPELEEKLKKTTLAYSPELIFDGNILAPEGGAALEVLGVSANHHKHLMPLPQKMKQGSYLAGDELNSVVIGQELAKTFQFNVGDQLILNYQDYYGELSSEILVIKGIFDYNSRGFQKKHIYISQRTWQNLYFRKDSSDLLFNRITVLASHLDIRPQLEEEFKGSELVLKSWKELNPELGVINDFQMAFIKLIFVMMGVAVTMTILNPVQMAWQERLQELKLLNIMGISTKDLWKFGFFEFVLMVILSGLASSLVLFVVLGIQSRTGLDFSAINKGVYIERGGIIMPRLIFPTFESSHLVGIFAAISVVYAVSYATAIRSVMKRLTFA
ncbi:MAG: ABC transporter permease [Bdellovibrionales bacterium]|nr:ABC transporter permease [Bdellovibrionales bacterium]